MSRHGSSDPAALEGTKAGMKIAIAYVHPIGPRYPAAAAADRFAGSYLRFPPGALHELWVLVPDAASPPPLTESLLELPIAGSIPYDNAGGWDVSAYLTAARTIPCDLLVCLGAACYFHREGWLAEMALAFRKWGRRLFGVSGSFERDLHVRTNAFWCPPEILRDYQWQGGDRFTFETGVRSITRQSWQTCREPYIVGYKSGSPLHLCRSSALSNIFRRGDQSDMLVWDKHTDDYAAAETDRKRVLEEYANGA